MGNDILMSQAGESGLIKNEQDSVSQTYMMKFMLGSMVEMLNWKSWRLQSGSK